MELDLFGAFESGEGVDEVAPPQVLPEESKKRFLESSVVEANDNESELKKTNVAKTGEATDDGDAGVSVTRIRHTQARKIEWSGRTVLTSSALPEGYVDACDEKDMNTMPKNPAKVYPFELDPFQKQSIAYIERNESVLVAAHTSAGKTVVAEYAVARSIKKGQRVIYTSPIKALSNQKFRDMQEEFGVDEVGLMTGDITINPTATCLIMTTEILRSMLYRGSEVMREVAWVIYDEIHYMRDKERGVVWEESIILLPHKVRFVFLSATIPNAQEFVGWIAQLHHQPCHVVYTDYRPTPLQHYIFPAGGEGLHLVVDDKGVFREDAFQHAMAKLQASSVDESIVLGEQSSKKRTHRNNKKGNGGDDTPDLSKIIRLVMDRNFDPVIVFSFAKRECESNALLMSKQDFNSEEEKELVVEVFNNAIDALSDDDKTLPQVENLLPILRRGIGIHHGGLLPILKEVIEILFQEGLLKVLFATETFSIGLNMPAHTVIFTACRKFDGKDFRWISAGEYIQMAGRAGRRGKDTNGIVIQMLDEKMEPAVAKGILYGEPDELYSSYHVSYNMLLNMLRVEGADPSFLVKSSFHQYQQEKEAPALEIQANEYSEQQESILIEGEGFVEEYFTINKQLIKTQNEITKVKMLPENILPFLQTGRLVHVAFIDMSKQNDEEVEFDFGWGVVVDFRSSKKLDSNGLPTDATLEVILSCRKSINDDEDHDENSSVSNKKSKKRKEPSETSGSGGDGGSVILPAMDGEESEMRVIKVSLKSLRDLSTLRIFLPKDLTTKDARQGVSKTLGEVKRRLTTIPSLDPVKDMKVPGIDLMLERKQALQTRLEALPFHKSVDRPTRLAAFSEKFELGEKAKLLRKKSRQAQTPVMRDAMKRMQRVLKRLGHMKSDGVMDTKGRVACEVNTADELVVTELVFGGAFVSLGDGETAALLSCLVFGERRKEDAGAPKLRDSLVAPYRQLQDTVRMIATVSVECKMELEVDEYLASFNPDLMEVVYAWVNGARFIDIIKLTTCYEGTVIRVMRRLEELLRQLANASFVIGNMPLKEKFERCAASMRRDIVFAASLYL